MSHNLIKYLIIPLIFLVGFTFNFSFAEENPRECRIRVSLDQSLSPLESITGIKECSVVKKQLVAASKDDISKVSVKIIKFCEQIQPIFYLVNEKTFHSVTHHPFSRPCYFLYNDPIWDYSGPDRPKVLLDFVYDKIEQNLEDTKDERLNSVRDARIKNGRVMFLEDLFIDIIQRQVYLDNQIQENNEKIIKNKAIIHEQDNVIFQLSKKTKNIVLTSSHSEIKNFISEEVRECIIIVNSKSLSLVDKVLFVQQCAQIHNRIPIEITDQKITRITHKAIKLCNDGYTTFLVLSFKKYLDTIKHPLARECAWLYQQPIWTYEGPDRAEKMFDFVKEHVKQEFEESVDLRIKSVTDALTRKGRLPALVDYFNFFDQKIESLDNQIEEQQEIIAKQEAIIGENTKKIQELSEKIKQTSFEPILSYFKI